MADNDLAEVDDILVLGNIDWTGSQIRKRLAEAGYLRRLRGPNPSMTTPRYRSKSDPTKIIEAIQFIQDDPTTHWHVNFGHPVAEALQGKYWALTPVGAVPVRDGDWMCKDAAGAVGPVPPDMFAEDFEPVPAETGGA